MFPPYFFRSTRNHVASNRKASVGPKTCVAVNSWNMKRFGEGGRAVRFGACMKYLRMRRFFFFGLLCGYGGVTLFSKGGIWVFPSNAKRQGGDFWAVFDLSPPVAR